MLTNLLKNPSFKKILFPIEPNQEHFLTLSGKRAFSNEYIPHVPYIFKNHSDASVLGTAFDYLVRFRIGQLIREVDVFDSDLIIRKTVRKLSKEVFIEFGQKIQLWLQQIQEYIQTSIFPNNLLYDISIRLAKIEHLSRTHTTNDQKIISIMNEESSELIIDELIRLMDVFEHSFIQEEIITEKSEVVFNPHFGAASLLVGGADADILIDGTLYDLKTTKDYRFKRDHSMQLLGYYLLNELAIHTQSGKHYEHDIYFIDRLALYKGRYGEIEYVNIKDISSYLEVKKVLKDLAIFLKPQEKFLYGGNLFANVEEVKNNLEKIRDGKFLY